VKRAHEIVRRYVARLTSDRPMTGDIERIAEAIRAGEFDEVL